MACVGDCRKKIASFEDENAIQNLFQFTSGEPSVKWEDCTKCTLCSFNQSRLDPTIMRNEIRCFVAAMGCR